MTRRNPDSRRYEKAMNILKGRTAALNQYEIFPHKNSNLIDLVISPQALKQQNLSTL